MTLPPDAVRASYAACRRLTLGAHSSFHAGFFLLPRAKWQAMDALYAFMRHTDDLADSPQAGVLPRDALGRWRAALDEALAGRCAEFPLSLRERVGVRGPSEGQSIPIPPHPGPLPEREGEQAAALLPALADTVARYRIPAEHLHAVIDGVEMDLDRRRYETFEELELYCRRVASAVGLACIYVWGFRGPEALAPATQAGIALQLTNILRDLKEDAAADRVYLPLADLRQCGYSVDDLRRGVADDRFRRLMAIEVRRAEACYRQAAELLDLLEPDGRRLFGLMMATYRRLLEKIRRQPERLFAGRLRLGRMAKLRLVARWTLLPPRKADLQ